MAQLYDEQHVLEHGLLTKPLCHFITVDGGQANVQQDDLGKVFQRCLHGARAVVRRTYMVGQSIGQANPPCVVHEEPNCGAFNLTMIDDEAFLQQFEAGAVPLGDWHHREHIKAAYLYLRRYPFDAALARIRESIQAYNAAQGVPNLPTRGYHETMTQAWMCLVYATLCEYGPAENADAFCDRSPQLTEAKALRLFYSADLFMSPRAKLEFVEPDLAPLPRSKKPRPE